jgi:hypothetical protein
VPAEPDPFAGGVAGHLQAPVAPRGAGVERRVDVDQLERAVGQAREHLRAVGLEREVVAQDDRLRRTR